MLSLVKLPVCTLLVVYAYMMVQEGPQVEGDTLVLLTVHVV